MCDARGDSSRDVGGGGEGLSQYLARLGDIKFFSELVIDDMPLDEIGV